MAPRCFKKIGSGIILFFCCIPSAFAGGLTAELESDRVALGQNTVLRVSLDASIADAKMLQLPQVPGLTITFQGSARNVTIVNFDKKETVIFTYLVTPSKIGTFVIPPITFTRGTALYSSAPCTMVVYKGAAVQGRPDKNVLIQGSIEFSKTKVYAGEPVILRVYAEYSDSSVYDDSGISSLPIMKGASVHELKESRDDVTLTRDGITLVRHHVASFALLPALTGTHGLDGGSLDIIVREEDEFMSRFFSDSHFGRRSLTFQKNRKRLSLASTGTTILVGELPEQGKGKKFSGDVGFFSLSLGTYPAQVALLEEVKIQVSVSGSGNFFSLSKPYLNAQPGMAKIMVRETSANFTALGDEVKGEKQFVISIIPEQSGELSLGNAALSFFNPQTGRYDEVKSPEIRLSVKPGPGVNQTKGQEISRENGDIPINWIPLVIAVLVLGAGVLAFILWENRRLKEVLVPNGVTISSDAEPRPRLEREPLLQNCEAAVLRGDVPAFVVNALRILEHPEDISRDPDVHKRISAMKDRLFHARYGGGSLTHEDIEAVHKELRGIIG